MASINKLMKQAMRAQQQAQEVEAALADRTVEATSGGGAVKVVATCKGELKSVTIEKSVRNWICFIFKKKRLAWCFGIHVVGPCTKSLNSTCERCKTATAMKRLKHR